MSTTTELKPCPFCNCSNITTTEGDTYRWMYVECAECGAKMEVGKMDRAKPHNDLSNMPEAIAAWNRRTAAHGEPSKELFDALQSAFMTLQSSGGEGRTIILKFNKKENAYTVHEFLLRAAVKDDPAKGLQAGSAEQVSEREEDLYVINRLATILADVAIALKGPELPLHRHGYHDLAEKAQVLVLERDLLRHQVEEFRAAIQHTAPAPSKAGEWNAAIEAAVKICELWNTTPGSRIAEEIRALSSAPAQAQSEDARDAARYRWLRHQQWDKAALCVVAHPKDAVKLGHDCPSLDRLDEAIDAAMSTPSEKEPK